ncbi:MULTISPECIES: hypothetical protein [Pectobacterium]|uniref:Uncharacterized protein n=1 Tax=Pectobacterium carotovorum subsp. carotovorum (strain PC1) TaxID=561230 RepID=C6D961_PECCP|nr:MULTISPECIES: hypothetical protein [Pectobacterium]ACT11769.1 hypothetical protein PC1_0715 [Pectobacterium carotovorum subsp. carotovorum PC1]AVT57466.1 Hypothetical protein OA04_08300 [Pectobacterium versatile]MCL6396255.1 hypothetical protein [Pectobacterium carotovorum subsp. carotovorum]GBO47913.1 hypothetical protein MFFDBJGM_00921 [Pectobacterium versatile]
MITLTIAGQSVTLDEREALSLCDQLFPAIRNPATVAAREQRFGALLLSIAPTPAASDSPRRYCASRAGDALTNC